MKIYGKFATFIQNQNIVLIFRNYGPSTLRLRTRRSYIIRMRPIKWQHEMLLIKGMGRMFWRCVYNVNLAASGDTLNFFHGKLYRNIHF